jgi:AraC-like DNA-binding protein
MIGHATLQRRFAISASTTDRATEPFRAQLLASSIALVEDLHSPGVPTNTPPENFSAEFQVCFPYSGAFTWQVGHDHVFGDANQVLFVRAGESFRVSQRQQTDYGELIVTPEAVLLADLLDTPEQNLSDHALFANRSRLADPSLQRARAQFFHALRDGVCEQIAAEESAIALLREALMVPAPRPRASVSTARVIAQTKEFLAAHFNAPARLSEIAGYVGVTPAYLTTVFSRYEGIPVHRYLTQLRLAQALLELPHATDLTALALEVGFSNHSHFTATFRRAFGCTPSAFRERTRRTRLNH